MRLLVYNMSKHGKRKYLIQEITQDECHLPDDNQRIVKVLRGCGNDVHEVEELGSNETYLALMPGKFRRTIWVKRGSYLIVNLIENNGKIKGEIVQIIMPKHKDYLMKNGVWPEEKAVSSEDQNNLKAEEKDGACKEDSQPGDDNIKSEDRESYDDAYNFVNMNRQGPVYVQDSSSDTESE